MCNVKATLFILIPSTLVFLTQLYHTCLVIDSEGVSLSKLRNSWYSVSRMPCTTYFEAVWAEAWAKYRINMPRRLK